MRCLVGLAPSGLAASGLGARCEVLARRIAVTGIVSTTGAIGPMDDLPMKLDAAAQGDMETLLVPAGQSQAAVWDLIALGLQRRVTILLVRTLADACVYMTGQVR